MKAYFGRRYTLSASHRLHTLALSADENLATYGKCNHAHGHGHNYVVEVLTSGLVDAETGMVLNMSLLDAAVQNRILDRFDHNHLNLDPLFADCVPTTENLCRTIFALLDEQLAPARLESVRVEETENNFFEFAGTRCNAR